MTDKEKRELKDGVISIFKRFNILDHTATIGGLRDDILRYINSLQEEPVSEDLEEASKNHATERYRTTRDRELAEKCKWSFKAGAEWGKNQAMAEIQAQSMALAHGCPEEKTSEDLKNAADNALESITDQYDIISVGSCLEMFRLGSEWKTNHLWKDAQGDDLPEIDREVIALLDNGKVVFAHRPYNGKYIGKNLTTGNIETFENQTYDKGDWNQPNVRWWLDIEKLPNMEERI